MAIVQDAFNETAALENHDPDFPAAAGNWAGGDVTNLDCTATGGGKVECDTTSSTYSYVDDVSPGNANYWVETSGLTGSSNSSSRFGPMGRWTVDGSGKQGYYTKLGGDGAITVEEFVDGSDTERISDSVTDFATSTIYEARITFTDSDSMNLTVKTSGVEKASGSYDNCVITAANYIGIYMRRTEPDVYNLDSDLVAAGPTAKAVAGSLTVSGALARKVKFKRAVAGAI